MDVSAAVRSGRDALPRPRAPRTSLSPPPPLLSVRAEPMESTSSMKMIDGACSLRGEEQVAEVGSGEARKCARNEGLTGYGRGC
jgi:hypothetical protein